MDHLEYLDRENKRRDENRTLLGIVAFLFTVAGLFGLAQGSQSTETKSEGHLWWKEETVVAIPTETRLAWLLGGAMLLLVAVTLAVIAYRSAKKDAGHYVRMPPTEYGGEDRIVYVQSDDSAKFWISTAIAVIGLLLTAASTAAAWFAG